jgi:hypothetical protein
MTEEPRSRQMPRRGSGSLFLAGENPELTPNPLHLQVALVLARLSCSAARARAVAELAFSTTEGRRA